MKAEIRCRVCRAEIYMAKAILHLQRHLKHILGIELKKHPLLGRNKAFRSVANVQDQTDKNIA
jgi:hypothetical protein